MNLEPPELVVVSCREHARPGVPFTLVVTDRRVSYARLVSFKRHRVELVHSNLPRPEDVTFRRRSPWVLWGLGAFLLAFAVFYVGWFLFGSGERSLHLEVCLGSFLLAFGCLAGGRSRWVLKWRDGARRHRLAQPVSYNGRARATITAALRDAAALLGNPARLQAAVALAREQATIDLPAVDSPDPDANDRRLCSDGACTGLLGANGRCKVCGKQSLAG